MQAMTMQQQNSSNPKAMNQQCQGGQECGNDENDTRADRNNGSDTRSDGSCSSNGQGQGMTLQHEEAATNSDKGQEGPTAANNGDGCKDNHYLE
jgi:hypothetical protein